MDPLTPQPQQNARGGAQGDVQAGRGPLHAPQPQPATHAAAAPTLPIRLANAVSSMPSYTPWPAACDRRQALALPDAPHALAHKGVRVASCPHKLTSPPLPVCWGALVVRHHGRAAFLLWPPATAADRHLYQYMRASSWAHTHSRATQPSRRKQAHGSNWWDAACWNRGTPAAQLLHSRLATWRVQERQPGPCTRKDQTAAAMDTDKWYNRECKAGTATGLVQVLRYRPQTTDTYHRQALSTAACCPTGR
jgi:hypothetical protein